MMQVRIGNKLYTSGPKRPPRSIAGVIANTPAWLKWPLITYIAAAFIYMAYCEETQTGLVGYIMALELERDGTTAGGIAFVIGLFVLIGPPLLLLLILRKIAPDIMTSTGSVTTARSFDPTMTWKRVAAIAAVPLVFTMVAVPIIYFVEKGDVNKPVYSVNLDDATVKAPESGMILNITGLVARRYIASFRYGNHRHGTDHIYAPLVANGWTRADPVRFVVHEKMEVDNWDQPFSLPYDLGQQGPAMIQGKAAKSLPVVIEREFHSKGLTLAPSFLVVERETISRSEMALIAPALTGILGLALTLLVVFALIMMRFSQRKRMTAKTSA